MDRLFFFGEYLARKHGAPLHRVAIDLPLSCPHRVRDSGAGCVFCPEDGARARHLRNNLDIARQVSVGVEYLRRRYGANPPYIAHFQSFTGTFADVDTLRKLHSEALSLADFAMVIISTRPDCLGGDIMAYLSELAAKYDLWVELGAQSANDDTLRRMNRAHDFRAVEDAAARLAAIGVKTAAHVILGLPGETLEDYLETARKISALPFSAVKIHNLLVLKNTPLAKIYAREKFPVMNEHEYAFALTRFIRALPQDWPLMRICSDAESSDVVAPRWWMKKGQFVEFFREYFESRSDEGPAPSFGRVPTADGSPTFFHPVYQEHFHSLAGAASESQKKFVEPSRLRERLSAGESVRLLDVGFGLGYNALAAVAAAEESDAGFLEVVSLEKDARCLGLALGMSEPGGSGRKILEVLSEGGEWRGARSKIRLVLGDARESARKLDGPFDVVFHDPFSPEANVELWTLDFFRAVRRLLSPDGVLLTYSSAFPVRGALLRCGFRVGETPAFGRKNGGTMASLSERFQPPPLRGKDLAIITKSTAGAAYRDPGLNGGSDEIVARRGGLVERLRGRGVPKWLASGDY